jgi:hypothetical protein
MEQGPIYIGGLDRSGKTTMRAFLASHPNIAIPDVGSNMWTYFYGQYGDLGQRENFENCLNDMLHYKHVRFLQPDADRIRQEFWQGAPTYGRLFSLFLIHYAERQGKPRWGAQTGLIERYADHLFAAYPNLKIVHMIRDLRDRYEASLALWPSGKLLAGGATARWLYSTQLAEQHLRNYPNQYKIVRYETLVERPEETLREVCEFLDEEYAPEMLAMAGATKYRDKLLHGAILEPGQSPLSPQYIGLFRDKIPKGEIAFMQFYAGRKMRQYDYKIEPLNFSPVERLRYAFVDWPSQFVRMAFWRTMEAIHQNFPGIVGRKPGSRMIIDAPLNSPNKAKAT